MPKQVGLVGHEMMLHAGMKPTPMGDGSGQQVSAGSRQGEPKAAAVIGIDSHRDKPALLQRIEDCGNRRAISPEPFRDRRNPLRGCLPEQGEKHKLPIGQVERS